MKTKGLALIVAAAILTAAGCKQEETASGAPPQPVQVAVTTLQPSEVSLVRTWPGRISAIKTAQIRPQVGGIVVSRLFSQGSDVKTGQPLFQIDPAPFEADVQMANAALVKAEATYRQLRSRAERLKLLQKTGAVSHQDYDDASANSAGAAADVAQARATLERRKLELAYSTVRAPIDGRIDQEFVTEGALVSASDTQAMATIQQTRSVYIDARLPAAELRGLLAHNQREPQVTVSLFDENNHPYNVRPRLLFSGINVNNETGDVVLRAESENPQGELMPGMFVRVKISRLLDNNGIAIPEKAIQHAQDNTYVWLETAENKAERKQIEIGDQFNDKRIVLNGLKAGDKLIIEGKEKLQDGIPVESLSDKNGA